jgi:hypothetical protein
LRQPPSHGNLVGNQHASGLATVLAAAPPWREFETLADQAVVSGFDATEPAVSPVKRESPTKKAALSDFCHCRRRIAAVRTSTIIFTLLQNDHSG